MTIYLARSLASVLFALSMVLGVFATVDAAHAYRPAPHMQQKDMCKNLRGVQTVGDIIYGNVRPLGRSGRCKRL